MPTVIDETVVNQAYDTSGNGGRKLIKINNVLVAVVKITGGWRLYSSADNGNTWTPRNYVNTHSSIQDVALVENPSKNKFYLIESFDNNTVKVFVYDVVSDGTTNYSGEVLIDTGQTALGNVSLAINSAGTELHAAWASKNNTYPNSFNIRYTKGTINADGSVTWGAVSQVTTTNITGLDNKNPAIVLRNDGKPVIVVEYTNTSPQYRIDSYRFNGTSWDYTQIYGGGSYAQSSPSACVAPNGRIWVAWYGYDATDTNYTNIRVSYSDDGGQTWSAMQKLTNGNTASRFNVSITANSNNEIFVVYRDSAVAQIAVMKYNGSWGSPTFYGTNANNPSALLDTSLNFSVPLFIYTGTSKVGFYGTWTATTISVTPGYIGQKSDKSNILTYSITTDGTMSTITEKINGVTIATRTNPTSGQQFTVSLTQEQWDSIKYGNAHTLTIEMGSETWTYTFDKRLNANDDILSAVKGVQDLQTHLNAIKAQLASAIRAKGGTVNDTDAWSAFVSAVNNITIASLGGVKFATGTVTSSSTMGTFNDYNGNNTSAYYLSVTGLPFTPNLVLAVMIDGYNTNKLAVLSPISLSPSRTDMKILSVIDTGYNTYRHNQYTQVANGFILPLGTNATILSNKPFTYYAFQV